MYPSYVPSGYLFLVEMTQVHVAAKIADLIVVGLELFKVVLTRFNSLPAAVTKGVGVVELMVWSWLVMTVLWHLTVTV